MTSRINIILNEYMQKNNISRNKLSRLTGISYGQIQAYCDNKRVKVDLTILERRPLENRFRPEFPLHRK